MHRPLYMLIFAGFFILVIGSIHYYLWMRLVRDSTFSTPWKQIATGAIIVLGVSLPVTMFIGRTLDYSIAKYLVVGPYIWLGTMMLFFFAFLCVDLVKLGIFAVNKFQVGDGHVVDPSRRVALGRMIAGGTAALVGGLSTASVIQAAKKASVETLRVGLANFPSSLEGLKLVQLSDIHIGETIGGKWLQEVVDQVNGLEPDIVVITGDLVDGSVAQIGEQVKPLANIRAKRGVFFVTGNHEYYSGVGQWIRFIEKQGIRVLRNERVKIGDGDNYFYLAGVDDYRAKGMVGGHGADLTKALKGRDENKPVVLLAHQPAAAIEAGENKVDLVLSGHTHGGQIWPFTYLVGLQQPYNKGLYQHNDHTQVYVNQGTGLWGPPMRLGTKSEITYIRLTKA